jgi:2-iminobutanoate/2-iminopropanoate deaminase
MKTEVVVNNVPIAGPYSQAVSLGDFLFVSGQIGIDAKTNNLVEGIKEQVVQTLENLKTVLKAADSDINNIVKTTVYLSDMNNFPVMNEIYATYFKKPYPARATIAVVKLPKGALVEIDCIAYKDYSPKCCKTDGEGYCGGNGHHGHK